MANIRNDSAAVAEAHRQAEIIHKALYESDLNTEAAIAQTLLDIWQFQKPEVVSARCNACSEPIALPARRGIQSDTCKNGHASTYRVGGVE